MKWEYFPRRHVVDHLSTEERRLHNRDVFKGLEDILDEKQIEDKVEKRHNTSSAYQLMNLKNLENAINTFCVSRQAADSEIDDFIRFCVQRDNKITNKKMCKLKEQWQQECEKKSKSDIEIQCKNIGLDAKVTFYCNKTSKKVTVQQETTMYHGTSYDGTRRNTENCSWYATNLRLVLATLAAGMGPTEAATFCSFMGLPDLQSFSRQQFRRIESLIGKHLRDVGKESMQNALAKEVEITKQKRKKQATIQQDLPLDMIWVGRNAVADTDMTRCPDMRFYLEAIPRR